MDDGTKVAELMFKASIAAKMALLKILTALLKLTYERMRWMKEHNIKSGLRKTVDKVQGKCVKQMVRIIEKKRDIQKEMITFEQRKLDKFTLDKKYELENYKAEVLKAQKAYEAAKERKAPPEELEKLQNNINIAKDKQRIFEYETSKECMKLSHEIDNYKYHLEQIEYDLKICNQKLNALYSHTKIDNEVLNNEFENLKDNYIKKYGKEFNNENIKYDREYDDKDTTQKNNYNYKDVDNNYNKEAPLNNEEYVDNNVEKYDNIKNEESISMDNMEYVSNNDDRVTKMFERDPEALKILEETKKDTSFNLSIAQEKNTDIKL